MAPSNTKVNFKTYEAQYRLMRAIVAAYPEVKWNYKDIAKYFGQSTPDGIQFQFRSIKRDSETLRDSDGSSFPTASPAMTTTTTSTTGGGNGSSSLTMPSRRGRRAGAAVAASSGRKRVRPAIKRSSSEEDDQEHEHDAHDDRLWSDDYTPSKRGKYAPSAAAANGKELSDSPASSVAPRVDDSYDGYGDGEI